MSVSLVKENLTKFREFFFTKIPTLEGRETYNVRLRDFASATVWKPFLIALSLMFFFQFSGINVILHYTVDIFQSADSSVEEFQVKHFFSPVFSIRFLFGGGGQDLALPCSFKTETFPLETLCKKANSCIFVYFCLTNANCVNAQ